LRNIRKRKRLWLLALAPVALILNLAAVGSPAFAEWYATVIYPLLSLCVNTVTSLVPFSVAEVLLVLLVAAVAAYIVFYLLKFIKDAKNRAANIFKFIINPICAVAVLYFLFTISCGVNYSRYPFAQTCGLTVQPSSKAELVALCDTLVNEVNTLRKEVKTDGNAVMKLNDKNIYDTAKQAQATYNKINTDYPLLRAGYGEPKPVFGSRLMSYCNITGIFVPFTFEANVNADVPNFSIPFTMCHELSHLRGYMREDEANFIGYLVCEKSDDADFRYSGKMLAFINASNALYAADSSAANAVYSKLGDNVRRDLANNSDYWKKYEGPVADAAGTVNDQYLKANRQEDGVKSYGRMVDLLLAEYRTKKETR
jgi:amino acid transporter